MSWKILMSLKPVDMLELRDKHKPESQSMPRGFVAGSTLFEDNIEGVRVLSSTVGTRKVFEPLSCSVTKSEDCQPDICEAELFQTPFQHLVIMKGSGEAMEFADKTIFNSQEVELIPYAFRRIQDFWNWLQEQGFDEVSIPSMKIKLDDQSLPGGLVAAGTITAIPEDPTSVNLTEVQERGKIQSLDFLVHYKEDDGMPPKERKFTISNHSDPSKCVFKAAKKDTEFFLQLLHTYLFDDLEMREKRLPDEFIDALSDQWMVDNDAEDEPGRKDVLNNLDVELNKLVRVLKKNEATLEVVS